MQDDGTCPNCGNSTLKCNIAYHMHDHYCSKCGFECGRNIPEPHVARKWYIARHKRLLKDAHEAIARARSRIVLCEKRLYRWGEEIEGKG